jgi:glycosyltransferase involved in cell wall biosynthesis
LVIRAFFSELPYDPSMQKYTKSVIIRSTSGVFEPRFESGTQFLTTVGSYVSVIAWARTVHELDLPTKVNNWTFRCAADYGRGYKNYFMHFKFMKYTYQTLKQINAQVIYACDIETLIPALIWGKRKSCIIIYDQFDPISIKTTNWFLKGILAVCESFLVKFTSFRVTANISRINKNDSVNWIEIKNLFEINPTKDLLIPQTENQMIFYGGVLSPDRGLMATAAVVNSLQNWKLEIFGQGTEFTKLAAFDFSKVTLHGPIAHKDLMNRAQRANLYLALYDPRFFHNRITASNKLFEAAQLGIPLLASKNTELGEIVQKRYLGWAVKFDDVEEISYVLKNYQNLSQLEIVRIKENLRSYYYQEKNLKEIVLKKFKGDVLAALEM